MSDAEKVAEIRAEIVGLDDLIRRDEALVEFTLERHPDLHGDQAVADLRGEIAEARMMRARLQAMVSYMERAHPWLRVQNGGDHDDAA